MGTKLDIKFRLKQRKIRDPKTGLNVQSSRNVLITMRVVYGTINMELTTGYHINLDCWDTKNGVAIGTSDGKSADEINNGLTRLSKSIKDTVFYFEEKREKPTADEFKAAYMIIKDGITPDKYDDHKPENNGKKAAFENQDNKRSIQGNESSEQRFNKLSDSEKDKNKEYYSSFWNAYHEYETYAGKLNVWSENTRKRHEAISNNLKSFRDWKRKNGYPDFEVTFDYFDEKGVQSYVDYLCEVKMFVNSTIRKDVLILKTVIRWAYRRHYHNNDSFEAFNIALKSAEQEVVYLNKKELEKLEKCEIPESKLYLIRVRDVFLFLCYTGLRYSDLVNLRRCDVHERYIEVTTIKNVDSLRIELNTHSKAILKKYEPFEFQDGKVLPVVSNQNMNQYLHELCQMAGLDEEIRITYYRGSHRFDEIKKKYELIVSHTGRRSFICNALSMGISPQVVMKWTGFSDYKAMKPYIDVCDDIKAEAMKKFDDF